MKKRAIYIAIVAFVLLGTLVTRAFWEGKGALNEGERAMEAGKAEEAVRRWRRAARWYVPSAPHVAQAYERLRDFAKAGEESGNRNHALIGWRAIRNSALATRSFYQPYEAELQEANKHIATLMGEWEVELKRSQNQQESAAFHLKLLKRNEDPQIVWVFLALLGFIMWVGSGFIFAHKGISSSDQFNAKPALYCGLLFVCGLLLWTVSLYLA